MTDAARTPRARARVRTMAEIVRIGRAELARSGAAALSLRAVARELGVVSSAVYRYVPSRDALLTLLIEDAYDELADQVSAAEAAVDRADLPGRLRAAAHALRAWARAEPARYGLLYGGPVPGYAAPPERTTGPGTRVIRVLTAIVAEADAAGLIPAPTHPPAPALSTDAERIGAELGSALSATALGRALTVWTGLFGAVGFEVFGQYGPGTFTDPDAVFDAQVSALAGLIGL